MIRKTPKFKQPMSTLKQRILVLRNTLVSSSHFLFPSGDWLCTAGAQNCGLHSWTNVWIWLTYLCSLCFHKHGLSWGTHWSVQSPFFRQSSKLSTLRSFVMVSHTMEGYSSTHCLNALLWVGNSFFSDLTWRPTGNSSRRIMALITDSGTSWLLLLLEFVFRRKKNKI